MQLFPDVINYLNFPIFLIFLLNIQDLKFLYCHGGYKAKESIASTGGQEVVFFVDLLHQKVSKSDIIPRVDTRLSHVDRVIVLFKERFIETFTAHGFERKT